MLNTPVSSRVSPGRLCVQESSAVQELPWLLLKELGTLPDSVSCRLETKDAEGVAYLAGFATLGQARMPTSNQRSKSFALAPAGVVQGVLQVCSIHYQPHQWALAACLDRCQHAPGRGRRRWSAARIDGVELQSVLTFLIDGRLTGLGTESLVPTAVVDARVFCRGDRQRQPGSSRSPIATKAANNNNAFGS
jgi:hypothetical protein